MKQKNNYLLHDSLPFLLVGIGLIIYANQAPIGDFGNYYYASRLLAAGRFSVDVYEPYLFNEMVNRVSPETVYLNYTPVPPCSALFYLPFSLISDVRTAKWVFSSLGLFVFLVALTRLTGMLKEKQLNHLWLLSLLFLFPLLNNMLQGQSYLYLLACLLEGFHQWLKGRKLLAGILWSIPIALKIFPGILLLFPILRKDGRTTVATVSFAALLSFCPYYLVSKQVTAEYFLQILPRLAGGEINDPYSILYQSASVLIDRALQMDAHLNPTPIMHAPQLAAGLYQLFRWLLGTWLLSFLLKREIPHFTQFSICLFAGSLLTGYGSSYGLLLLLPLVVALILRDRPMDRAGTGSLILIGTACSFPIYLLHNFPLLLQFPRLYALLGTLCLLGGMYDLTFHRGAFLCLGLFVVAWFSGSDPKTPPNNYYLASGRHGIIFDYHFANGAITLKNFNKNGSQQTILAVKDTIWQDDSLHLRDRQVYYRGTPITTDQSRKRRPMRLNTSDVLYLTDHGRGPGFYTLRKIALP